VIKDRSHALRIPRRAVTAVIERPYLSLVV
jgi:hypothetical protein